MGSSLGNLKVVAEKAVSQVDEIVIISKESLKPQPSDK